MIINDTQSDLWHQLLHKKKKKGWSIFEISRAKDVVVENILMIIQRDENYW